MKLKVYTDAQFDLKQTAKIYATEYGRKLAQKLLQGVDKIDYYIVNH